MLKPKHTYNEKKMDLFVIICSSAILPFSNQTTKFEENDKKAGNALNLQSSSFRCDAFEFHELLKILNDLRQECIPVGCVPPAC